ncbi:MAG TPA: hypothetical protein VNM45_21835 [Bacillus sp. (in: firmicutes)]|nr:hypothetical protein [Bacillus sp. (in: firmicutes)]
MKKKPFNTESVTELSMDTPLNPDFSMGFQNNENPYATQTYTPGDSVEEHHVVEEANQMITAKELGQQNNNS